MAKKRPAKKAAKTTKTTEKQVHVEEIVLSPGQDKAIRLVEKSAKVRGELEEAVKLAATKVVRKCMKDHGIQLTAPEATLLMTFWFEEE